MQTHSMFPFIGSEPAAWQHMRWGILMLHLREGRSPWTWNHTIPATHATLHTARSPAPPEPLQADLRLHVEKVANGHVGVALSITVSLSEEFVFGPGHVHALGPSLGFVVRCGVGGHVPVVDELGLMGRGQSHLWVVVGGLIKERWKKKKHYKGLWLSHVHRQQTQGLRCGWGEVESLQTL